MAWSCSSSTNGGLVRNLRSAGLLSSARVELALRATDRACYVSAKSETPYADAPSAIGFEATISAPHMHAMALELLAPALCSPSCLALDVGCGSGYLAACLHRLVEEQNGRVFAVDYLEPLTDLTIANLTRDNPRLLEGPRAIQVATRDGWHGWPEHGPFDAIHVGAAAASVPEELVRQLKPGGRLVIPVGPQFGTQKLLQIDRDLAGEGYTRKVITGVRYVPLVRAQKPGNDGAPPLKPRPPQCASSPPSSSTMSA
mmetsp:Transcript_12572/g.40147  ORF Transcript_12572/g.40147 Transcript_12572/m.40147 type:complete len:257 (+) Transcript_12572:52-822(+)